MKWTDKAALAFFGACALLTLGVSIPATYAALRLFHDDGSAYGWVLAAFALLVFEVGAVGAKLATLAVPQWTGRLNILTVLLLSVTTFANYAHGHDLAQAAKASPTLAAVLADPAGAAFATVASAALFPLLLLVFLSAFVARCKAFANGREAFAAAREDLAKVRAELAAAHATLAEQARQLADERERPVLDVRAAMRLLVAAGAPEATIRTWIDNGRLRLVEGEEVSK